MSERILDRGRVNAYICTECGARLVTVDEDDGTTPGAVVCKVFGCGGTALSLNYHVAPGLEPTHEWFRPASVEGLDACTAEHVRNGGLLLRERKGTDQ